MDIAFADKDQAFRDEVKAFLGAKLPREIADKVKSHQTLTKEEIVRWHRILNDRGWLAQHWPVEYGGTGWSPLQQYIFEEEADAAGAPRLLPFGLTMVAPVIMKFGSQEQKDYYLPRILTMEDWWCQGYSEPGAGSDLASLNTRAAREGDHYVINGQKTWTTLGQHADMIFCLVRTNSQARKKQQGISFLLIDMNTPGITVRPLITLDGKHEVNEVFFDDVKVPVANRVGEENDGWTYAKFLLTFERTNIAGVGNSKAALQQLKTLAHNHTIRGVPLIEQGDFAERLADVEMELMALEMTNLKVIMAAEAGDSPGPESSFLKIMGTEIRQRITELYKEAAGPYALPFPGEETASPGPDFAGSAAPVYFNMRKLSIFGGSNEIQKNIISKGVLGL